MSTKRTKYSRDFKLRAIELSYERESISDLAHELEIRPALLYRWRAEFRQGGDRSFPGEGKVSLSEEELRIKELEKALKNKELELEILKKAIGIFSKKDSKSIDL